MADKQKLISLFEDIAMLLELKGENPFKAKAYQTAARAIEKLDSDLEQLAAAGQLENIKGIGKAISQKIQEYLSSGQITYYDELKASVPPVIFDLIRIPGLGPRKALVLHQELGIQSIGELDYACRENRLVSLPGFGRKTQEKVLQGIEYVKKYQGQFLLSDAWPIAEKIAEYLKAQQVVADARVAGSIRRRKETVKDIDIVVASDSPEAVAGIVAAMPGVSRLAGSGPTKTSVELVNGMNLDVRAVLPGQFPCALHHFTGSKEHHVLLRGLAKERGLKINEYAVESGAGALPVPDEKNFYKVLGLQYIEPEMREGLDEIGRAADGSLPALIAEEELKGVFHVHTIYSDGSNTIREMADAAQARGWSYLGVTDHSRTAVYARGLKLETVLEQRREIAELNEKNPGFAILAGIESDILPDGALDYPDDVLAQFDFVIASVHSAFRQSEADMTRRIIRALDNPYVSILGHPTGRILLARDAYRIDLEAVIRAAADTGTIIEINANPYRLDLNWQWCRRARELGVLLAINPDAHSVDELAYVRYGTAVARKGGLTAGDVANTRLPQEVLKLLRRKHPKA